jgi:hypothetical protein
LAQKEKYQKKERKPVIREGEIMVIMAVIM